MKLDLSTPEPAPDPKAWDALVAKTGPLDQRLAKLTRTDASGIAYPLVAETKQAQETPPLGETEAFNARLGRAPTWDVRAVLSCSDDTNTNRAILDALNHGATTLELRANELLNLSLPKVFNNVTREFVSLVVVLNSDLEQAKLDELQGALNGFKHLTWVLQSTSQALPKLEGDASVAVSSLEAVDLGAHPSLEIAYLLSAVLERYRASAENYGTVEQAIALYATTESTLFMNIAKLRSLRRLYEGIRKSLAISAPWELMTLSSPRAWTRDAPWNNQLRGTASIMSASIAGATSIGILPATHTLESQRVALSAHSVIALESHLGQVDDPARGSYLIETLTDALAQQAWAIFQSIEKCGGLASPQGWSHFTTLAQESLKNREDALSHRKRSYVGVSEFPSLDDDPSDHLSAFEYHARDSALFEAIRHQPHSNTTRILTVGSPARHLARKTFAEHALAAGGIEAEVVDLASAQGQNFSGVEIICGHDDDYEEAKEEIATLVSEPTTRTYLASKHALDGTFTQAQRLFLGMNLVEFLESITHDGPEA